MPIKNSTSIYFRFFPLIRYAIKVNIKNHTMYKSSFTLKIILIATMPVLLSSLFSLVILFDRVENLSQNTTETSREQLEKIYKEILISKSNDITQKVDLKLSTLLNELNILRSTAQRLIDGKEMGIAQTTPNNFIYDPK